MDTFWGSTNNTANEGFGVIDCFFFFFFDQLTTVARILPLCFAPGQLCWSENRCQSAQRQLVNVWSLVTGWGIENLQADFWIFFLSENCSSPSSSSSSSTALLWQLSDLFMRTIFSVNKRYHLVSQVKSGPNFSVAAFTAAAGKRLEATQHQQSILCNSTTAQRVQFC